MNQLGFTFRKCASTHCDDHEIRVLVDGKDLLEDIDDEMLGLDPPDFFKRSKSEDEESLFIGRCSCGVLECGSVSVSVTREGEEVRWEVPGKYGASEHTLVFDSTDYDRAFERAAQDTSWETIERTTERLISQLDFTVAQEYGFSFQSANARAYYSAVRLNFVSGPQNNYSYVDVQWNHEDPLDAMSKIELMLKDWQIKGEAHDLN